MGPGSRSLRPLARDDSLRSISAPTFALRPSEVVGLPLYESMSLLGGEGYPVHFGWLNAI